MLAMTVSFAALAAAVIFMWHSNTPDETRSLQLCKRLEYFEFIQETGLWAKLGTPIESTVVCAIPGTTQDVKIEGLLPSYRDTPLSDQMVNVDCYYNARIKSGVLPVQMPDGLYCNIPIKVE